MNGLRRNSRPTDIGSWLDAAVASSTDMVLTAIPALATAGASGDPNSLLVGSVTEETNGSWTFTMNKANSGAYKPSQGAYYSWPIEDVLGTGSDSVSLVRMRRVLYDIFSLTAGSNNQVQVSVGLSNLADLSDDAIWVGIRPGSGSRIEAATQHNGTQVTSVSGGSPGTVAMGDLQFVQYGTDDWRPGWSSVAIVAAGTTNKVFVSRAMNTNAQAWTDVHLFVAFHTVAAFTGGVDWTGNVRASAAQSAAFANGMVYPA